MKKKVYGKILALTLAASMVSVPVFAEESADGQQVEASQQNEEENSDENAEGPTEEKEETKDEKSSEEDETKDEKSSEEGETKDNSTQTATGNEEAAGENQLTEEEKQAEPEVRLMEQNAQPVTLSGECGATEDDEVTWELAKNGETLYRKANENGFDYSTSAKDGYEAVDSYTLTISGEGNMKDYYAKGVMLDSFAEDITPWRRALLSDVSADRTTQEVVPITQVVVSSGITGLGTSAFAYTALNKTVEFNKNVTYYGSGVYSYCPLITTVDFTNFNPENVTDYWVAKHEMLTGNAVPYGFFDRDKNLDTCIINGKVYAGELALPENIDTICTAAFRGTGFNKIDFSNGLKDIKEIGPFGISALANIDTFTYPGTVNFYEEIGADGNKISRSVLSNSNVKKLIIKADVTELPDYFAYCLKNLEEVVFEDGSQLESIGLDAFGGCEKLESVEIGKVKSMGRGVFINCPSLKSVKIEGDESLVLSGDTFSSWGANWPAAAPLETFELGAGTINCNLRDKKNTIKTVKLGDGVKNISNSFLNGCNNIETIEIGNGITKIGDMAFMGTNIKSFDVPDSVTEIGNNVFKDCAVLANVNISDNSNLETIGTNVFRGTAITSINIPENVTSIGACSFQDLKGLTTVNIAENSKLESISNNLFSGSGITSITIPDSVTQIGANAFQNCEALTEVNISKNSQLQKIDSSAFFNTRILKMYLPSGVKSLGTSAFQKTPIEIYDASDIYSSDFTIGDWCINNWYKEGAPSWANNHKDIYVNNSDILKAVIPPKKSGSVQKTCYVTNGGTVDMDKAGFKAVSREGYTVEWYETEDFSGTPYKGNPANGKEYYAKWILTNKTDNVEVTYEPNLPKAEHKVYAASKTEQHLAKANLFSHKGYHITAWNTERDGNGTSYAIGEVIPTTADITVYAQWALDAPKISVTGKAEKTFDNTETNLTASSVVSGVTYQWQKDGEDIEGATEATYAVKNVADSGSYTVKITDADGKTAVSNATKVEIAKAKPAVTIKPSTDTLKGPGSVTFTTTKTETATGDVIVTCDDEDVTITEENGVYTAKFKNLTKTYKFTASYIGDANYADENAVCTVSVTKKSSSSGGGSSSYKAYDVTIGSSDNGTVKSSTSKISSGSRVTLTTKADEGYKLREIKVTDANDKEITLAKQSKGIFSFTMPSSNVEVKAVFTKTGETKNDESKTDSSTEEAKTIKMQIGNTKVTVDDKEISNDVAPVIVNDRTLVPIRIVTETLGGEVGWNDATKTVTLKIDGKEITMTIGKVLEAYGVAPQIINSRTYVPIRFVADELGSEVNWNEETKEITIVK